MEIGSVCVLFKKRSLISTLKVVSVQRYAKLLTSLQEKQYNVKRTEKDLKQDFQVLLFNDSVKLS